MPDITRQPLTNEQIQERGTLILSAVEYPWPAGSRAATDRDIFVTAWEQVEGIPHEDAVALAKDPLTLFLALLLEGAGLDAILGDRYATAGLRRCLADKHGPILRSLGEFVAQSKPKGKLGPRPKAGGYIGDRVVALREQGLSFGQIAMKLWNDSEKRYLASAHFAQAKKKRTRV